MKKFCRAIAFLLVVNTLLSGCSMLTSEGRRERAYDRYVRKSSQGRVKQQKRFAGGSRMPVIHSSEPAETTEVSGPESVGEGDGQ